MLFRWLGLNRVDVGLLCACFLLRWGRVMNMLLWAYVRRYENVAVA